MAPTATLRLLKEPHFIDAVRAAGVAALLALPLLGFRLVDSAQGLTLGYRFSWVVYAALAVFLGRLALFYSGGARRAAGTSVGRLFSWAGRGRHHLASIGAGGEIPRVFVAAFPLGLAGV